MKAIDRHFVPSVLALSFVCSLGADDRARQEFHGTYALPAHGRLAIENLYGDVHISGWDRKEVRVEAMKRASGARQLDEVKIVVDESAGKLSVRTQYDGGEAGEPASVEYQIRMPRTADLEEARLVNGALSLSGLSGSVHGSSVNGDIQAKGLAGRADLATVNGQVAADFDRISGAQLVSLRSVNGPILLTIPSGASARFNAQNRSGAIESDLPVPGPAGHRFQAVVGAGATPIRLHNVNGGISIHSSWSRRHERFGL